MTDREEPITIKEAIDLGKERAERLAKENKIMTSMIAKRIKLLRIENKLTQDKVSKKVDVNRITYAGYENERSQPNAVILVRLAKFYDVSLDYLCGISNKPHGNYAEEEEKKETTEKELLKKEIADLQKRIENL